jgi:hypothetical protein
MRTLKTLRDGCIDEDFEYTLPVVASLSNVEKSASALTSVFQHNDYLKKGFYSLNFQLVFQYVSSTEINASSFHNSLFIEYSDETNASNVYLQSIHSSNSFITKSASENTFEWLGEVLVHVKHNTNNFSLAFSTIQFDGMDDDVTPVSSGLSNCPPIVYDIGLSNASMKQIF